MRSKAHVRWTRFRLRFATCNYFVGEEELKVEVQAESVVGGSRLEFQFHLTGLAVRQSELRACASRCEDICSSPAAALVSSRLQTRQEHRSRVQMHTRDLSAKASFSTKHAC